MSPPSQCGLRNWNLLVGVVSLRWTQTDDRNHIRPCNDSHRFQVSFEHQEAASLSAFYHIYLMHYDIVETLFKVALNPGHSLIHYMLLPESGWGRTGWSGTAGGRRWGGGGWRVSVVEEVVFKKGQGQMKKSEKNREVVKKCSWIVITYWVLFCTRPHDHMQAHKDTYTTCMQRHLLINCSALDRDTVIFHSIFDAFGVCSNKEDVPMKSSVGYE